MATMSTRDIDWSVVRLSGGFTSARRTLPAHHGSLRPSDWKLEEAEEGPLSERGEDLARDLAAYEAQSAPPIVESLMPMALENEALAVSDTLPPQSAPASRRRPSRGANAFWSGSAAVMSVVALGLVIKLGVDSVHHARKPRPLAAALASTAASNEATSFPPQSVMTLDTVYISATVAPFDGPPDGSQQCAASMGEPRRPAPDCAQLSSAASVASGAVSISSSFLAEPALRPARFLKSDGAIVSASPSAQRR